MQERVAADGYREYKYYAFISYSHSDKKWGNWLHTALETYKIPGKIRENAPPDRAIPRRLFPIFRDLDELPTSADLGEQIQSALRRSRFLIVICSPRAAQSLWVNEEIKYFKLLGRENRILPLIVAGEPNAADKAASGLEECLPHALRFKVDGDGQLTAERSEPIAADARETKDGKKSALLKLIAGLLGVDYDALKQRDHERHAKRMKWAGMALATLALLFAGLAWSAWRSDMKARSTLADIYASRGAQALSQRQWGLALASYYLSLEQMRSVDAVIGASVALSNGWAEFGAISESSKYAAFCPNGRSLAALSEYSQNSAIILWDILLGKKTTEIILDPFPSCVAFTPDGSALAIAYSDATIRIWDVASSRFKAVLKNEVAVRAMAFRPDGQALAVNDSKNSILIKDLRTGDQLASLTGHTDVVKSVAFSPDGQSLASGSNDRTFRVWDAASGKEVAKCAVAEEYRNKPSHIATKEEWNLLMHERYVNSVAFSPDGRTLAAGSHDGLIRLWDVAGSQVIACLTGHERQVLSVAFSLDGRALASGGADNTIRLWDVASGKEQSVLRAHTSSVSTLAVGPDGRTLASGSYDKTIRLWDMASGVETACLLGHTAGIGDIAFNPDGRSLVSSSGDHSVRLWDVLGGQEIDRISEACKLTGSPVISPDGLSLVAPCESATFHLWDLQTGNVLARFKGHSDKISAVAFSPDGNSLASGSKDTTVRLWDAASGRETAVLQGHKAALLALAFSPDGRILASSGQDKVIRVWDTNNRRELFSLFNHQEAVTHLSFSSDGLHLISGSSDKTLCLWDLAQKSVIVTTKLAAGSFNDVAYSAATGMLALPSGQEIRLVDSQGRGELAVLEGHTGRVRSVAFSPDGRMLVSCDSDNTIRLWARLQDSRLTLPSPAKLRQSVDKLVLSHEKRTLAIVAHSKILFWNVDNGVELARFDGYPHPITALALSSDGGVLASGAVDKTIRLWDMASGKEIMRFVGHTDSVNAVAISSDGRMLASGSKDKTARVWDIASGKELATLQAQKNVEHVFFSTDGRMLFAEVFEGIRRFDWVNGKDIGLAKRGKTHPDGKNVVAIDNHNIVLSSLLEDNKSTIVIENAKAQDALTLSRDGRLLAHSNATIIQVTDVDSGKTLATLRARNKRTEPRVFSPDGSLLWSDGGTNARRAIHYWDWATGKELSSLSTGMTLQFPVVFSEDNTYLIARSANGGLDFVHFSTYDHVFERAKMFYDLGVSYDVENNGARVERNADKLASDRLDAARKGSVWWFKDGGKSRVPFYEAASKTKINKRKTFGIDAFKQHLSNLW